MACVDGVRLTIVALMVSVAATGGGLVKQRLLKKLLANYDKRLLPTEDPFAAISVKIRVMLGRIEHLDEKLQALTSFGWLVITWTDELLVWDPSEHGGVESVVIPANEIWLPELGMLNSVVTANDLSFKSYFRVRVNANGSIDWVPGMRWQMSCPVKLTYFPFDQQTCMISFASWVYTTAFMDLVVDDTSPGIPAVWLLLYEPNSEWRLDSATLQKELLPASVNGTFYPFIHIVLRLSRHSLYFVLNTLVPCIVITLLSMLVYLLPSESGEKVTLAITVLLSYTVLLLFVSDVSPRNGDSVPLLTMYLLFGMVVTALSLQGAVCTLCIFHASPNRRVPPRLRTLFLRLLPRLFGMNPLAENHIQPIRSVDDVDEQPKTLSVAEREVKLKAEWQLYARVIDRALLIFYGILTAGTTVYFITKLAMSKQ